MTRIALGTAQFGIDYGVANRTGKLSGDSARAVLALAREHGIDTLDTAAAYGDSEQRLGRIGVADWRVVTKLPRITSVEAIADDVDASLVRLGQDTLYGLLLHAPMQLLEADGPAIHRALREIQQQGLVRKIGVSVYHPDELDALIQHYSFDLVQVPLNVVDRRIAESGLLSTLVESGVEVHARSILLQGLLAMEPARRPTYFAQWAPLWTAWGEWLVESGQTALEACLRHVLAYPEVERLVVGVDGPAQLAEVLAAASAPPLPAPAHLSSADPQLVNPSEWRAA